MIMKQGDFKAKLKFLAGKIDLALENWLSEPCENESGKLNEACRYSVMAGGKRIRAILPLMVGDCYKNSSQAHLRFGCSLELIHAYSLIHDDLPAMDDDDFRRGKPSNHKVFGEAMAILAGDNLLTTAFEWLANLGDHEVSPEKIVEIIKVVSTASGREGMIGGQVLDLTSENRKIDLEHLEKIHRMKTGALIFAPVICGAILSNAPADDVVKLSNYAWKIGLLFQIIDDILDVEGNLEELGKAPGSDARLGKSTYPGLLGLEGAKKLASETYSSALNSLSGLSVDDTLLAEMAEFIYSRKN